VVVSDVIELLLYLYAESPVHAGAADSLGVLDLPVQREATTGYPVIWGQSLKGALRQAAADSPRWGRDLVQAVFGSAVAAPEDGAERGETTAGLLAVGDAQLVAMPVPTLQHTFAWATSELALGRLARKHKVLLEAHRVTPTVPSVAEGEGTAASGTWAGPHSEVLGPCLVPLGEQPSADLAAWAERLAADALGADPVFGHFAAKLRTDLLLVGDSVMPALLRECTELAARVQLGAGKTVANGPFYSEYLPAETIMAASLSLRRGPAAEAQAAALVELLDGQLLQVGGDETLGKGLVWARLLGAAATVAGGDR
jgi:CRISPR-associated protein Cmr4